MKKNKVLLIASLFLLLVSFISLSSYVYASQCGNSVIEKGEKCDDGNNKSWDGCSYNCQKEKCTDFDEIAFKQYSPLVASYLYYDQKFYLDTCENENQVKEYICDWYVGLDIWNIKKVPRQKIIDCRYGCNEGACMTEDQKVYMVINKLNRQRQQSGNINNTNTTSNINNTKGYDENQSSISSDSWRPDNIPEDYDDIENLPPPPNLPPELEIV